MDIITLKVYWVEFEFTVKKFHKDLIQKLWQHSPKAIYMNRVPQKPGVVFLNFLPTPTDKKPKLTLPGLCRFKLIHFHVSIVCCAVEVSFYHAQYRHGVHGSFLNLNGLVTPGSNRWLFPKIRRTRISSIQQYCTPCWQISPNFYSSKIP